MGKISGLELLAQQPAPDTGKISGLALLEQEEPTRTSSIGQFSTDLDKPEPEGPGLFSTLLGYAKKPFTYDFYDQYDEQLPEDKGPIPALAKQELAEPLFNILFPQKTPVHGAISELGDLGQKVGGFIRGLGDKQAYPADPSQGRADMREYALDRPMTPVEQQQQSRFDQLQGGGVMDNLQAIAETGSGAAQRFGATVAELPSLLDVLVNPEKFNLSQGEAIDQTTKGLADLPLGIAGKADYLSKAAFGEKGPHGVARAIDDYLLRPEFITGEKTEDKRKRTAEEVVSDPIGSTLFSYEMGPGLLSRLRPKAPKIEPVQARSPKAEGVIAAEEKPKYEAPKIQREEGQPLPGMEKLAQAEKAAEPIKPAEIQQTPSVGSMMETAKKDAPPTAEPRVKTAETPTKQAERIISPEVEGVTLKKAEIRKVRQETNLKELSEPERKTFEESVNSAIDQNLKESALDIAKEIKEKPRQVSGEEHAALVMKYADLKTAYKESTREISDLVNKGDSRGAEQAINRRNLIWKDLDLVTEASAYAGTEAGRALSIRRMTLDPETYSVVSVRREAEAIKRSKLTEDEIAKFEKLATEHDALQKKLDDVLKERDRLVAEAEAKAAEKIVVRERKIKGAKKELSEQRSNIKKQLQEMGFRVNDITGVTTEGAYLIGKLAVNYIREGAKTLEEVVSRVQKDIPDLSKVDVYKAINTRDPKVQAKVRSEVEKRISVIKREARLLKEIADAEKGIFKKGKPQPLEIRKLQGTLRALRDKAYKSGMEGTRIARAVQTIGELQSQLNNFYRPLKKTRKPDTGEIATLKEKIADLRKQMRIEDTLADLNEQLRTGEFKVPKGREQKPVPVEIEKAQIEIMRKRKEIRAEISNAAPVTTRRVVGETLNTFRTMKATADMSAVLRQALVTPPRRPLRAGVNFGKAFKSFFSEYKADQIHNAIMSAPHHYIREKSGLYISNIRDAKINAREEMFMSNLAEKIPLFKHVVKASERHMVSFLNLMRTSMFDDFLAKHPNATIGELKAWADFVNVSTGRGNLGRAAGAGEALATVFFAPRLAVSRVQYPGRVIKYWKMPRVRKEIAKDMAAFIGTGVATLKLAKLAGFEVGADPRSADFGKIRFGDTRIDIWGGFQQPARTIARLGTGLTDKAGLTGKYLSDSEKAVKPTELFYSLLVYKLSPAVTLPIEYYTGETAVGEPTTPPETAIRSVTPLIVDDIREAYESAGIGRAVTAGSMAFFGLSVNTYADSETQTRRNIKKALADGDQERAIQIGTQFNINNPDKYISPSFMTNAGQDKGRLDAAEQKIKKMLQAGKEEDAKIAIDEWNANNKKKISLAQLKYELNKLKWEREQKASKIQQRAAK